MIMNILVLVFVLGITYAWMVRGAFNSMLHMLCVLIAGAIAFAFWEKLAIMLINASPDRGFFSILESIAWGVSLVIPFVIYLLVLRVVADKLVPNNIKNASIVDYAGGAACGLVTSVVCAGILVLGVENMRLPTNFLGYRPLWYSPDRTKGPGSLVESDSLWIPADRLVAKIYAGMSRGAMSSAEPMAKWYPDLALTGFASRLSPGDGAGRNALKPSDFNVKSVYTVGNPAGTDKISDLLKSGGVEQKYVDINNEPVSNGTIYGYVVEFEPGAKERGKKSGGQLVVSNGQLRLLVADEQGSTKTIFPMATISESNSPGKFGRWKYDASDVFITSTGGQSRITMGFEFVVPQGYTPLALSVRNVRADLSALPKPTPFATPAQRDLRVTTGSILDGSQGGAEQKQYVTDNTITIDLDKDRSMIFSVNRLMDVMSTTAAKRGMTINEDNEIVDGVGNFDVEIEVGRRNAPTSKALRCERYAVGAGQSMIKINVGTDSPLGFLSGAAREAPLDQPLILLDENGNEYEAIGFEYQDSKIMTLRYTRGSTLTGIQDTPTLSTTRDDQKLNLIFIVTKGVKIDRFAIGDILVARFTPPID